MPDPVSDLPYPLLVNALTGTALPPVSPGDLGIGSAPKGRDPSVLGYDRRAITDPNNLTETGWGIIFASGDKNAAAIKAQLQPLIDLRARGVQDANLCLVFDGDKGVKQDPAEIWAQQFNNLSIDTPVDPSNGLPYYLLIVGSPDLIPFEFEAALKSQWLVGRLHFDDIEDYGRYARAIVQYEDTTFKPAQTRSSALWVTRNPGDIATAMLSGAISQGLLPPAVPLGGRAKPTFRLNAFMNEKATKSQLIDILRGNLPMGPPAVFFTGCHGCDYTGADPDTQRRLQGSFMTQEWVPKTPASPANQFTADDIPADAKLLGTVGFLFACFSGACPVDKSYTFNADGSPIQIAPQAMISRIPQVLLSRGMLAAIAHIDLAFPYAFQNVNGMPQIEAIRSPLEQIMNGDRVGLAADALTSLWNTRAAHLGQKQVPGPAGAAAVTPRELTNMTIARDDARNYIVLGDPAAKLRVADLK